MKQRGTTSVCRFLTKVGLREFPSNSEAQYRAHPSVPTCSPKGAVSEGCSKVYSLPDALFLAPTGSSLGSGLGRYFSEMPSSSTVAVT